MNNYNLKEINFSTESKHWKKFEPDNKSIALNILFLPGHKEEIKQTYISEYGFNRENKVIFLMVTDGKKWQYLAVYSLSRLLQGITSNHNSAHYSITCHHSSKTENKHKS